MSNARTPAARLLAAIAFAAVACSKPQPPPLDAPPEPQATQLRDAIQAPLDKARGAEDAVQAGAERQRAAIEDAGG